MRVIPARRGPRRWRSARPGRAPRGRAGSRPSAGSAGRSPRARRNERLPQCGRPPSSESAASTSRNGGLVGHAPEDVHGHEGAVAAVRGREQGVVGGAEAQLDREADRVALERGAGAADGLDRVLARDAVLHLLEAHEPVGGEDPVGPVDALALRGDRGGEAVQARDRAREAARDLVDGAEGVVVDDDVARRTRGRARARRGASSVRSSVRVSATSACGKVQNSKWSCASARSCSASSTGSSGSGLSV